MFRSRGRRATFRSPDGRAVEQRSLSGARIDTSIDRFNDRRAGRPRCRVIIIVTVALFDVCHICPRGRVLLDTKTNRLHRGLRTFRAPRPRGRQRHLTASRATAANVSGTLASWSCLPRAPQERNQNVPSAPVCLVHHSDPVWADSHFEPAPECPP